VRCPCVAQVDEVVPVFVGELRGNRVATQRRETMIYLKCFVVWLLICLHGVVDRRPARESLRINIQIQKYTRASVVVYIDSVVRYLLGNAKSVSSSGKERNGTAGPLQGVIITEGRSEVH
jgi:hypothetical protein